jgi:phosphoribosyl-ATP pyrophosphohydrolase/phosphoribosyl-AMP cyclohydrolase
MAEQDTVVFDSAGLVTAVVQDAGTREVLMVAHMNREALAKTLSTGQGWYWSRRRGRLWRKGEESGHTQHVREVKVDCDGDALLVLVDQVGPACHTGHRSCFYRGAGLEDGEVRLRASEGHEGAPPGPEILRELAGVLRQRRLEQPTGSYSARLFAEGLARLNEKVMEEAAEVTRAARRETAERLVQETADLWFHTLALLVYQGVDPSEVFAELARRRR